MPNERNAGRKPKYKEGTETVHIRELIPKKVLKEAKEAIAKLCDPFRSNH